MSTKATAKVCMYRLNELGDCFLVTFKAGAATSRLLIDCGSFRNDPAAQARLKQVVADISKTLAGAPLDVVVGTHQHNDHVSGYVHCEAEFRTIGVKQTWLSWLDDPTDLKAQSIGKAHHNLKMHLAAARDKLHTALAGQMGARPVAARSLEVLDDILGFYGSKGAAAPPELPAHGVKILKTIGKEDPTYLKPGRILDMPGLPKGSVKVYVFGPPRVEGVEKKDDPLYRKDPRAGESYDAALAAASLQATRFLNAATGATGTTDWTETHYPFNQHYKRKAGRAGKSLKQTIARYRKKEDSWRTIDDDWMQQAEGLALYLDTFTNNSSLVLAIELVESGKVLLFAADAQTGNWLSWKDIQWEGGVKTDDLLARSVFYKVGHHASHNATLVEAFDKMRHPHLAAFIPVNKQDPNITKKNGWKMPATNLFKKLVEKTDHRVLQMDNVNPPECDPAKEPAKSAWKRAGLKPKITPLSIEIEIA